MKQIWKYVLENKRNQQLRIPNGASFRHVAIQNGNICLWYEVDVNHNKEYFQFMIFGTGSEVRASSGILKHLGSVLVEDGTSVFHVYIFEDN